VPEPSVMPNIHKDDLIFQFLVNHPHYPTTEKALACYFSDGSNSANTLSSLVRDVCKVPGKFDLLEFASGFGCVSRHFKAAIPEARITCSDIHDEAMRFIADEMGLECIVSSPIPENVNWGRKFDVVFALSFFSHMPKTTWSRWLKTLCEWTKPEGFMIFTTHGLVSNQYLNGLVYDSDGFWFCPVSEQKDIPTEDYGQTSTTPHFVFNMIESIGNVRLRYFREAAWWAHQDLYIIYKTK
jgi:cyclopropane fatty-acyl-phospholipid synthase-like methyltransferase